MKWFFWRDWRRGPPPGHYHHNDGGNVIGSVLGGIVGGLIGSRMKDEPPPPPPRDIDADFENAIHAVNDAPPGAVVSLSLHEFRALQDRDMIKYQGTVAFCLDRIISVVDE